MEELVLDVISRIIEEKRLSCKFPTYAIKVELDKEISKKVTESLNTLFADGKIKVGETINSKYIEIIK